MKVTKIISLNQAEKFFSAFFKFNLALLFKIEMKPLFTEGTRKAVILLEAEPFMFEDLEKFLKENYPEAWKDLFEEKK